MKNIAVLLSMFLLLACQQAFSQNEQTKKVAILETVDKEGKVSYPVKLMVRSNLSAAITNTPGYEAYDRVDISSIMSEQEFQRTGMVNEEQIKRLGAMIGVSYILVAEVAHFDDSHILIVAKILDVETARLMHTANIQTATDIGAMEAACREMANRLLGVESNKSSTPTSVSDAGKSELSVEKNSYAGEYRSGQSYGQGNSYYAPENNKPRYYESSGNTALGTTVIRWFIESTPRGADVYTRIVSSTPEVKNTNSNFIGSTPYESTETFDVSGLTYNNSGNVQIEVSCEKAGYVTQRRRFNLRQAIDQKEISTKFNLIKED